MKKNRHKLIILLFIAAHVIFFVMTLIQPSIVEGVSLKMFDLMMFKGYDLAYATTFINEISNRGRNIYLFVQIPLDFLYPLLLSIFFSLFFYEQTKSRDLAFLGFATMIFDYMENIFIILILTSTNLSSNIVGIASKATITKGIFYALNYGITVFLLIRCRYKKGCPIKNRLKTKDK